MVRAAFHASSQLTPAHWLELQRGVQRRVLRYFRTHGLLDEADADGMLTWRGSGGFSINASVRIEGDDRAGVERLLRYCARPPFAIERLYAPAGIASLASNDSRLVYRPPRPAPDGRTELRLTPLELLERLARIRWAVVPKGWSFRPFRGISCSASSGMNSTSRIPPCSGIAGSEIGRGRGRSGAGHPAFAGVERGLRGLETRDESRNVGTFVSFQERGLRARQRRT